MPKTDEEHQRLQEFVEFSEQVLAAEDVQDLLSIAVAKVAAGLDVQHAKVLQRQPDGSLLVVAGVGWMDGVVGNATLSGEIDGPPGFALKTGIPVRSADLTREARFTVPPILLEHGIRSAINVIIDGDGQPFGVLEVDSTEPREFTASDTIYLQGYAQLLSAALLRTRQTEELQAKSNENAMLLNELHHRIGNDFQLVNSLIKHRSRQTSGKETKKELAWISNRISALSKLHEQLRKANSSTTVDLGAYIGSLCNELAAAHNLSQRSIILNVETVACAIGSTNAVSIGLIINEFLTNSIEHAFGDQGGSVTVALTCDGDGQVTLHLEDDGKGYDSSLQTDRSGRGLMGQLAELVGCDVRSDVTDGVKLTLRLRPYLLA